MDNQVYQDCLATGQGVMNCAELALQADIDKKNKDLHIDKTQYLKDTYYRRNLQYGLSSLGFAGGLFYAYKNKKTFGDM